MERIFFGYAYADTNARECIHEAAGRLAEFEAVESALTWEDLRVDGKIIINDIIEAIHSCTIGVFDITSMNSNVLFELGIAIGAGKPVVITRESNNSDTDRLFREFALLVTTGYTGYVNSGELISRLSAIVVQPPPPLLHTMLGGTDSPTMSDRILYVPSMKEDQSSQALSRALAAYKSLDVLTVQLDEHGTSPLAWLTQQIYTATFAIFHFTPSDAYLADTSNRRASLLAGLATGSGRQVRLAIRATDQVALDYRDMRIAYANSKQLAERISNWLSGLQVAAPSPSRVRKHLPTELAALRFGNHVAEADADGLDTYFVETRDYLDVIEGTATIFTGRKGTGKTASMLQAARTLQSDARNVVCVIKPASYELEALCDLLQRIDVGHIGDYLIEGVWKYLLYTEVAVALVRQAESAPAGVPTGSPLDAVRQALNSSHRGLDATFSARLEDLIANLDTDFKKSMEANGIDATRKLIGKALYGGHIRQLRLLLVAALRDKDRVCILIDNLDKAWERGADLKALSSIIFGLLTAVGRVSDEHAREVQNSQTKLRFSLTAFLRSDIYAYVRDHAREPDKIASSEIEWRDQDLLARVLEDRFVAARDGKSDPADLWTQYFAAEMNGEDSRTFILSRVQPRPRDLVFFANAAVVQATNSRHAIIDAGDIDKAEIDYSQFAYEALLVEGVAVGIDMEMLLMAFVGERAELSDREARNVIQEAGFIPEESSEHIRILRQHGFLGLQTAPGTYDYGGTRGELHKADVLAAKLTKTSGLARKYQIHPAYRRHLAIEA